MSSPNPSHGHRVPQWPLPANPFTEDDLRKWYTPRGLPDDREMRELRDRAVGHAAYMHGDVNVAFERAESVVEMLKTAQEICDWVINGGDADDD